MPCFRPMPDGFELDEPKDSRPTGSDLKIRSLPRDKTLSIDTGQAGKGLPPTAAAEAKRRPPAIPKGACPWPAGPFSS